jgi:hypothetical protein
MGGMVFSVSEIETPATLVILLINPLNGNDLRVAALDVAHITQMTRVENSMGMCAHNA